MDSPDLIIRNAHLINPATDFSGVIDIAVTGDRIVGVGDYSLTESRVSIDASGMYASAGWIDLHTHVFRGANADGVDADTQAGVCKGVTTVIDAGSSGWYSWKTFQEAVVDNSDTRVLAFCSVSLVPTVFPQHGQWDNFSQGKLIDFIESQAELGRCLGVKVSATQEHSGDLSLIPLQLAKQVSRLSGTGLMVQIGEAPPVIEDVLNLLEEGDIVTHSWHGMAGGLLGRNKKPVPETLASVERGVKFDIGHGSTGFSFETARYALDAGLPIHAISTGIQEDCLYKSVFDLATTMSKFLHLGLELSEVVGLVTHSPASIIHRESDLGSIEVDRVADITLFRIEDGEFDLVDSEGRLEVGNQKIKVEYGIRAGKVRKANCSSQPGHSMA